MENDTFFDYGFFSLISNLIKERDYYLKERNSLLKNFGINTKDVYKYHKHNLQYMKVHYNLNKKQFDLLKDNYDKYNFILKLLYNFARYLGYSSIESKRLRYCKINRFIYQ